MPPKFSNSGKAWDVQGNNIISFKYFLGRSIRGVGIGGNGGRINQTLSSTVCNLNNTTKKNSTLMKENDPEQVTDEMMDEAYMR